MGDILSYDSFTKLIVQDDVKGRNTTSKSRI